ncbi:MAG: D-alanine--D-alanine ligase [Candidatus Zixiibacteriota bacterium]
MKNKLKILVLAGGLSEEREVSLSSARAITEALLKNGHDVKAIDSAGGRSLLGPDGHFLLHRDDSSLSKIALTENPSLALTSSLSADEYRQIDIVFLALHGGAGEDGTIQALLDLAQKKYTGSGQLASAIAMNKAFAKKLLKQEKIPTPPWLLLKALPGDDFAPHLKAIKSKFSLPIIVKPNNSGSTVGLTLVKKPEEIVVALKKAAEVSSEILIEKYIRGREITCSILNGKPLPLVEIIPSHELYDYQCKYTKGKSQYICPAKLPARLAARIQKLAARAYEIIGCSCLARADFILSRRNQPYFLEVNTLPGMTELSLAPMAARQAGISFEELVDIIAFAALKK